jgi:hypothetical protein
MENEFPQLKYLDQTNLTNAYVTYVLDLNTRPDRSYGDGLIVDVQ